MENNFEYQVKKIILNVLKGENIDEELLEDSETLADELFTNDYIKTQIGDAILNALNDFGGDQEFEDIYNEIVK